MEMTAAVRSPGYLPSRLTTLWTGNVGGSTTCSVDVQGEQVTDAGSMCEPFTTSRVTALPFISYISSQVRVVDHAVYFAERYGCEVSGIDISNDLIAQAIALAKKKGLERKVTFHVGDALQLPFVENEFDPAVSQAMLVLVGDQRQSIREALRVVKPAGYLGWLELSWRKPPTTEFLGAVSHVLHAYCMQNVHTVEGWENLLKDAGVKQLETTAFSMENGGMLGMLADEGLINTAKVMLRSVTNSRIRKRMSTMSRFFGEHADYFGYGIYTGRK